MDSQDVSSERERLQGTLTQVRQQILHKWLGKDLTDKHGNHLRLQQEFAKLMEGKGRERTSFSNLSGAESMYYWICNKLGQWHYSADTIYPHVGTELSWFN